MVHASNSLPALVSRLEKGVDEARRGRVPAAILAAATTAADTIEHRVGIGLNDASCNESERTALLAVQRFTFNAAADCWPGWDFPAPPVDAETLAAGLEMARRSARLVAVLKLGHVREGTGSWLSGAFELALGKLSDAASSFSVARQSYIVGNAPGLVLLTEGYIAIARRLAAHPNATDAQELEEIYGKITAGGFKDGPSWIEQLRTAAKVFAP